MVQLKEKSPIDSQALPYLFWWDELRRSRHNFYDEKISQSLDGIQKLRMSSSYIRVFFPSFGQSGLCELEIDRRMQKLGDFTDEEIELYQQSHPYIKNHIKHVFGTPFPRNGFLLGLGLAGYLGVRRINLFQVLGIGAIPMFLEVMYQRWNTRHRFEVLQFLDWDVKQRVSRADLERFTGKFEATELDAFKKNYGDRTVREVYEGYLRSLQG